MDKFLYLVLPVALVLLGVGLVIGLFLGHHRMTFSFKGLGVSVTIKRGDE